MQDELISDLDLEIELEQITPKETMTSDSRSELDDILDNLQLDIDLDLDLEETTMNSEGLSLIKKLDVDVMSMLETGIIPEDASVDEEDLEDSSSKTGSIGSTKRKLLEANYIVPDKTTRYWSRRYKDLQDEPKTVEEFTAEVKRQTSNLVRKLSVTSGGETSEQMNSIKKLINDRSKGTEFDALGIYAIKNTISQLIDTGNIVNADEDDIISIRDNVIESIQNNPKLSAQLEDPNTAHKLIEFITSIVRSSVADFKRNYTFNKDKEILKKQTAKYLLKSEIDDIARIVSEFKDGNVNYIRQIFTEGGDRYYYKCYCCEEEVELNGKLSKLLFNMSGNGSIETSKKSSNNSKFDKLVIPRVFSCSNGSGSVLPSKDYDDIIYSFEESNKHEMLRFRESVSTHSIGTPIMRAVLSFKSSIPALEDVIIDLNSALVNGVPISKVVDNSSSELELDIDLPDLVQDDEDINLDLDLELDLEVDLAPKHFTAKQLVNIDNNMFKKSTELFYRSLYKYSTLIKDDTKITINQLAYYVATTNGKDWVTYKNQAIASLIISITENNLYGELLDHREFWKLQNYAKLAENTKINAKLIPSSQVISMRNWYIEFTGKEIEDQSTEWILEQIKDLAPIITDKLNKFNSKLELGIHTLKQHERLLGHIPILNINSIGSRQLNSVLCDQRVISLVDNISDRMIINSLSYQVFKIWRNSGILTDIFIRKNMVDLVNGDTLLTKMSEHIQKSKFPGVYKDFEPYLDIVTRQTVNDLEIISKLTRLCYNYDYYSAMEYASSIKGKIEDLNTMLYVDHRSTLTRIINDWSERFDKIKHLTKAQFYLVDFNPDTLSKNEEILSAMSIGRYIPNRSNSRESVKSFITRYESLVSRGELNNSNSRDSWDLFQDVLADMTELYAIDKLIRAGYPQYVETMFISQLIDYCASSEFSSFEDTRKALSINPSAFKIILVEQLEAYRLNTYVDGKDIAERLISVPLYSSVEKTITKWADEYKLDTVKLNEPIDSQLDRMNAIQFVNTILFSDPSKFVTFDGTPDYVEVKEELEYYLGDHPLIGDLVRGE